MGSTDMLLSDFQEFSSNGDSEVRELMERIYQRYCRKLDEKAGLRRKMKKEEVVSYEIEQF